MPYRTNKELPKNIKNNLPSGAQTIYRKAFNNAVEQYKDPEKRRGNTSLEETSHKVAWAAVKKEYKKKGDEWVKK
jgi:cation transport regulator